MLPLLTRAQMVALDRLTIDEIGIKAPVLMEVAGRHVANEVEVFAQDDESPILALAGTGHNGADAVVAARHLAERGYSVDVAVVGLQEKLTEDAAAQVAIAQRLGVNVGFFSPEDVEAALEDLILSAGTVIDGLFGTGLSRPLEGGYQKVVDLVASRDDLRVVAVDIPSGIDGDTGQILGTAMPADVTVTFQFPKVGHVMHPGRDFTGVLEVADIGIPPSQVERVDPRFYVISESRLRDAFVPRASDGHKGTYGHLLVVAGAPDRPGAALLAGRAALRSGTGLVTVGSDEETVRRVAPALDALMGLSLGLHRPDAPAIIDALARRTALAIGPSLEADPRTLQTLKSVLLASKVPAVIDAGALSSMGTDIEWLRERTAPVVLTPHPGEMARLTGLDTVAVQEHRLRAATSVAEATGAHVVLKGAGSIIAHPDGTAGIVLAGNPGMATGGTGDVLTGVIGGLLAQGVAADVAAEAGALLHALAGDRVAEQRGEAGLMAPDLLDGLADVLRRVVEGDEESA